MRGLQHAGRKPITITTSAVTEIASISAPIAATSTVIPHSRPPMIITRPVRFLRPRPAGIFQPPANGGTSCKIWAVVRLWRTLPSKPRQTSLENSSGRAKGDVPAALNKWMENIAVGDKDTFNNLVSFLFVFGALEVPHMVLDFEQLPRHGALHLGK